MKKYIFRILAYIIDIVLLNLILLGLNNISFINHNISKIHDETLKYSEVSSEYNKLSEKLDSILSDNYIDFSESMELRSDYPYFQDIYKDIPVNRELDNEAKNNLKNKINDYYKVEQATYNYNINRYNIVINVLNIIFSILYFGLFEWLMKGKTLGKMLFRLKTLDNDKPKREIPVWKYLIKGVLVGQVIFNLASLICLLICHPSFEGVLTPMWYSNAYNIIYNIQYVYNIAFVLIILFRRDERSVHDILLNIRVALFDKKNKEITKRIFNEEVSDQVN